ncbi:pirin family protein [Nocardia cyriacigeorgica]|uniref:Pirin family protein n=1 Tax=Nocardia cyriacigeorgica TaxID=135487 RepID=A0A6P1CZP0_9NOCA|nr:pirin-like bicupin family protein [Nocardia cyriacigeorgica]NEW38401.1 pirin family protein [Nocardia cyriacigeorgica]NEW43635.1 pirin family protein [Nocardia cyriacigeorgica]NEW49429.1 pirin family protein [Nocardia cyriacigeorgica]NEW54167.1 pirin family protein [Nocardia cyriacigeorgica]
MSTLTTPHIDVHRGGDRMKTRISWLDSKHSFSFGQHYDPDNTHHGLLLVNNEDIVLPGQGFETHPHRDMEIVTWVLGGSLVHQDSLGHSGIIYPGLAQRMSAGTGIMHSEKNDSWRLDGNRPEHDEPVHFVQMWVLPDEPGVDPGYQQLEIDDQLSAGGLITVASGLPRYRDRTAIAINSSHSALHVARLAATEPGSSDSVFELPDALYLHVFVARGEVDMEGVGALYEGDAVRMTRSGGQRITARTPSEVLVWEMHARLGGP